MPGLLTLLDAVPAYLILTDEQSRIEYANATASLTYASDGRTLLGLSWVELAISGLDRWTVREAARQALADPTRDIRVRSGAVPVGEASRERQIDWRLRRCPTLATEPARLAWIGTDVRPDTTPERDAAPHAPREQDMRLREIHHRVKNDLQIISSLLHLQAKSVRAPDDRAAFEESRTRLLSMILLHDQLYQARDLDTVDFDVYARSLVSALVATFSQNERVRVSMNAGPVRLPVDMAVPTGLILCELVTNVFKYAYPAGASGTVSVDIASHGTEVMLQVRDAGVGFPASFDHRSTATFGWQLVTTLAQQLRATVETANDPGAHVRITYPIPSAG